MGWYDPAWTKRKQITIDNTKVAGASHTDFPVLISRTDADIKAGAQADGDDILFTAADGTTKLDHEIEEWNSGTGELVAWVRVPTLSGSVDTELFVYYGNPAATNQQNPTGVWHSSFKLVWHLPESSGSAVDSTANNNDGTFNGALPAATAAKIYNGQSLDGVDDYVSDADDPDHDLGAGEFTLSGWVSFTALASVRAMLTHGSVGHTIDAKGWSVMWHHTNGLWFNYDDGSSHGFFRAWTPSTSTLYYVVIARVFNDPNYDVKFYIDGSQLGVTEASYNWDISQGTSQLRLGINHEGGFDLAGLTDEWRIRKGLGVDDDYVTTEYNNQESPGTFETFGAEEEQVLTTLNRISGVLDRTASGVLVRVTV